MGYQTRIMVLHLIARLFRVSIKINGLPYGVQNFHGASAGPQQSKVKPNS
jgi:hypothetical protein